MSFIHREISSLLALGVPMVLAQVSVMAMSMTDALMVGRGAGTEPLAAMSFALAFLNIPCIALLGISSMTGIFSASAFTARRFDELPQILRHGVFLSIVISVPVCVLACLAFNHLDLVGYMGQPQELISIGKPYVYLYSAAYVFQLVAANFRSFCEAQNSPWQPMFVVAASIVANAFFDWVFIFGPFGLPRLGLLGAGMTTLICSVVEMLAIMVLTFRFRRFNLPLIEFARPRIHAAVLVRHLRYGIPTILHIAIETSAYSLIAVFAGRLGTETLAAHHISMQVETLAYMVPLGFSFAVSIRVSQATGTRDSRKLKDVCLASLLFSVLWMVVSMSIILGLHNFIPQLFTNDAKVAGIASNFLFIAGLLQIFDGLQSTALGALRGMTDVIVPMILIIVVYWVVEIPLAGFLSFFTQLQGLGIWIAMLAALCVSAILLLVRLANRISRA